MEKDLNKIVGIKDRKNETQFLNLLQIKEQIKFLNKELEKRIGKKEEEPEKEKPDNDNG